MLRPILILACAIAVLAGVSSGVVLLNRASEAPVFQKALAVEKVAPPRDNDEHGNDEHGDDEHGDDEHGDDEHGDDEHGEEGVVHLPPQRLEGLNIRVVPVHQGAVDSSLSMPAVVELDPDNEAHIVPRVRGIVREVHAGLGDQVTGGQLLAVVDSRELANAKSAYLAALASSDLARVNYTREKGLWEEKISAERDYIEAKAEYRATEIQVRTALQELHALGLTLEEIKSLPNAGDNSLTRYEIRAPFDATVVARHIATGETVGEEDEVFFLAKLDPVWVMGRAAERDLRRVGLGQKALLQLDAYPGEEFSGEIDYIGSTLDPKSRTVDVRLVLSNPEARFREGLFGQMLLFLKEHAHGDTLLIPNDALQRTKTGGIVYKAVGEGEFKVIEVNVMHASDSYTEVQGELAEGDRVAAGDVFVLKSEASKESMGGGHSH